jgi:hypothetical protein
MAMTNKELIRQTRDNLIAIREKITRKPKPNYNVDGQRIDWADYLELLTKQINELKLQLDGEDDDDIVEEHTTAYS